MRLKWALLVAYLVYLFSSFPRMSKLSKPYWRYQKNYIQCRTCDLRLFRTHTGLVSFRGSCRNKDGYQLCSYKPLWNQCPWLVKRCSSYCCRWSSHQTGLFSLLLKLLCVVHQHPSAKLRWLLCLLHQSNASGTHMPSSLLWCWFKRPLAPTVSAHSYCARLHAQIHMPRHTSSASAKY